MREILFRGKRIDNGEWVYGGYYVIPDGEGGAIHRIAVSDCERFEYNDVVVDPSSISEFTGLTDKNGKKIFEGDIVKVTGLYPDRDGEKLIWRQSRVGEVFYYHGAFYFDKWLLCKTSEKCIEVIGNIHDNPELLEDKL